ncbi:MAG: hypothetical protein HN403_10580 [Rhodospirillales bacterium]|jgi:uncharacterized protein YjbJ (UPF0337 family)|nr:hypothetical protein [Rhodospirillales bacterium]
MKRGILIGGAGLVVIVVVGVVFLWSNIGEIIKSAVEKFGTEILKAEVTLNEVDISTTSGAGALKGLNIGNPSGFETDKAFSLGLVSVKMDTGTITSDTIVIKEIVVQAPDITYEIGSGGSNLDKLKENADAYVKVASGGGGGSSSSSADSADGKKLIIEHLYIREAKMNVSATFLGGKKFGATLPEIHLTDIGKEDNGAGPGEIADQVISAITDSATGALSGIDFGDMAGKVTEQLGDIMGSAGGMASGAADAAKGQATDLMKKATEGTGGAGEALKGLFGGAKK